MLRILLYLFRILIRLMPMFIFYIALFRDSAHNRLKKAGFQQKDVSAGDVRFHYAESEDSDKPVLLLLHGHMLDWFSYANVLIPLAEDYHVYAIDFPGHGQTAYPDGFEMNAERIGSAIAQFIDEVIGKPVMISGHSSGGLLAVWLCANRPELIKALILEDPPLFSSEYPAIRKTAAWHTCSICDKAVREDNEGDFLRFALKNDPDLFIQRKNPITHGLLAFLIMISRMLHFNSTAEVPFVSPLTRHLIRGMDHYDPHFGQAFYEGTWNENFNHTEALCKTDCPVLLIHGDTIYMEDGTLASAMSEENIQFALSRLTDAEHIHIHASSVIHTEAPEEYIKAVKEFAETIQSDQPQTSEWRPFDDQQ